ncbi:MAG: lipoate--protein ligase [Coriobacteriales bacterium]|jgi:lipoate-protein ligase A|nr:lipoate--protein ligase [Coriobacteriales bacterium]
MQLLVNRSTDPTYNLALEEYVLTQLKRELVVLWRNSKAVILGQNQNAVTEVDLDYARKQNIAVVRRQSGGGAVFHDLGNVNYTLIKPFDGDDFGDYQMFTAPLRDFLLKKGVSVSLSGRNDLVIGDSKFSGNAQAVRGKWIMHHGCVLFNADFSHLSAALRPNPAKIASKGIRSVRSRVTNLIDHLPELITADEFFDQLADHFRAASDGEYLLTDVDVTSIQSLAQEKYRTWEWNIGYSPHYRYSKSCYFSFGTVELGMDVSDGTIRRAAVTGDFFGLRPKDELEDALIGVRHEEGAIREALVSLDLQSFVQGMGIDDFLKLF